MVRSSTHTIPPLSWLFSAGLLVAFLLLGFLSMTYANLLKSDEVTAINLYGQRTMSPERVKSLTEGYLGKPLTKLELNKIQESFLEYPLIRSAKATRNYPHSLDIYLYDVLPVAYISIHDIMTLDEKGILLPLPDKGMLYNLPIITGINVDVLASDVGQIIPDETVQMLVNFLKQIRKEHQSIYLDISEISYDRRGIKLISATHGTTVFLGNEDDAILNSLILEKFISEESDSGIISPYQYIDLRFDRQIIVKERETQ
ncbi:MAG: FtsQ-type POTRA domain-containing protein [Candidatus Marinimicrobia bacterium]|nr:FtsQ-type POTRA domain-containing protein [Candidatus Neomarinimicrobiota bacterium]MCF7922042.1 FtsQ-type POTRA domain-containing protein [Candidatus Neomarinimicrobiota bacterium]